MRRFKRNQVEHAIAKVVDVARPLASEPSAELRTRMKRLLDTDRGLGRTSRSADPERANFAFYSAESPGSGVEIWFSEYEAFALLIGLQLLDHAWAQGHVVSVLRRTRPRLEKEHARILKQDPQEPFDPEAIRRKAQPGTFSLATTAPVFLVISSTRAEGDGRAAPSSFRIFRDEAELMKYIRERLQSHTIVELVRLAHGLSVHLSQTEPRKRGRGG